MVTGIENRYSKISEYYKQISDYYLIDDIDSVAWYQKSSHCDGIEHFFGAEGASDYEVVARAVKEMGFDTVFDIGCAHAFQSECFLNEGIKYIGIDDTCEKKWNADKFDYLIGKYPFRIPNEFLSGKFVAVSRLCVGILITDDASYKQISETFPDLLVCNSDPSSKLQKYYDLVSVFENKNRENPRDSWKWYYYQKKN